jgi:hypothetical protein
MLACVAWMGLNLNEEHGPATDTTGVDDYGQEWTFGPSRRSRRMSSWGPIRRQARRDRPIRASRSRGRDRGSGWSKAGVQILARRLAGAHTYSGTAIGEHNPEPVAGTGKLDADGCRWRVLGGILEQVTKDPHQTATIPRPVLAPGPTFGSASQCISPIEGLRLKQDRFCDRVLDIDRRFRRVDLFRLWASTPRSSILLLEIRVRDVPGISTVDLPRAPPAP